MDERRKEREGERELVESRRCGGCYVLAQRPRSKLVSTRERERGERGGSTSDGWQGAELL